MAESRRLLRKKDIVDHFGLARSTVSDWMNEFQAYIPTVKDGGSLYYKLETIDVLTAIKELRDLNQPKPEIMRVLAEKGFPITVEEAVADVEKIVNRADYRNNLLTVMETVGQALVKITEQDATIQRHDGAITEIKTAVDQRFSDADGRITELERTLSDVTKQLAEAQAELAAAREDRNKSIWRKIFGGSR